MKTKLKHLIIFASAGAILHTGLPASAADGQYKSSREPSRLEVQGEINEPAGAELHAKAKVDQTQFNELKRASELIGTAVENEQDEKLGDIRDLMVDMESGRVPFAVLSSGGFFGVGSRLVAVPPAKLQSSADEGLMLSVNKEQLQSAPSFTRDNWPDMSDSAWSSRVYTHYNETPYWESSASTTTEFREPSGAEIYTGYDSRRYDSTRRDWDAYGETETGLSKDRRARQGLGAEDLTQNEQKVRNPDGYAASQYFIEESAGAETLKSRVATTTTTTTSHLGKVKRASDLIGMEVKNAQNEHIGEIEDLVIDMKSGRVAYAVLDPKGIADVDDKFYAVPPAVFTRSADEKWLIFKTDQAQLKTAPSFDKSNWEAATNQKFTQEVYSFYKQQPYWQGGQIREPSGAEPKMKLHKRNSLDSSGEWQKGGPYEQRDQGALSEPADQSEIEDSADTAPQESDAQIEEPAGAEPERQPLSPRAEEQRDEQSSAAREASQLESDTESEDAELQEPAGAAATTATRQDQTGSFDQKLSQQVRTALQADSQLSSEARNIQVKTANGKITLQGTVASEQEKQAIADKVKEITIDNQLQVKGESNP